MQIKLYPIGDLVLDSANARKHSERNIEAIMDSIREFGQYQPIVIQKSTRRILAGNGRFEALKRLGAKDVQCVEADVDNITATRLALADNRTAELAEWDFEVLQNLLGEVGDGGLPGWTAEEIDGLISSPENSEDIPLPRNVLEKHENKYGVTVICDNEEEQERTYNELTARGYSCRVVVV